MNRVVALGGVAVSAVGVAAALSGVYQGMRETMVDNGGFCASGGPYEIAPGHACSGGQSFLLTGGVLVGLLFAGALIWLSDAWSNGRAGGIAEVIWFALFGALGWNFLDLGLHPPTSASTNGVWIGCAVLFWVMALGGLARGGKGLFGYLLSSGKQASGSPYAWLLTLLVGSGVGVWAGTLVVNAV